MSLSLIGKRIGNYDIQAKIGEGGMGMVYLGIHPQIGKRVAIKVLHEELSQKADVVSRFFTEARSVNDISHPNIVDIVDFGDVTVEGVVFKYIIMEFLDGESLAARIRREGVTIRETIHIIGQCASALSASHAKGVVHRDLKPENVYLCVRGPDRNYVKLLDFGIAKLTGDGSAAMSSKTRTGMVIGTPAYMSPEQCEGRGQIDHRSDIYALGVVMYELLTGRVPFPGDGFGEVLVAHLTKEPEPPSRLNPNIPPEVEAIVMHCLRKDKAGRFQSMNEMFQALQDPVAHYQAWCQTAQLPPGMAAAPHNMGTVMSGVQPAGTSNPMWPSAAMSLHPQSPMTGHLPQTPLSGASYQAVPGGSLGALPLGSGPVAGLETPVISGQQPRLMTGMGSANMGIVTETPGPVIGQGPRPTTLSGASGEAGSGRRPLGVVLGLAAVVVVSVAITAVYKNMNRKPAKADPGPPVQVSQPVQAPVQPVQKPAPPKGPELVTVQVKTAPPGAALTRSDQPDAPPLTTPASLQVKKGQPVDITLRLSGHKDETRPLPTDGSLTQLDVGLTKIQAEGDKPDDNRGSSRRRHRSSRKGKGKGDSGDLLPPIF
jgi:serine/threonine-protein kinase